MEKNFVLRQQQLFNQLHRKTLLKIETEGKTFTYKIIVSGLISSSSAANQCLHATASKGRTCGV